jgi:hypothetical protein
MDQSLDSQYAQITQTAARGREVDRRLRLCHSNFGNTLYYLQQVPKYNIPDLIYIWRAACDVVVLTKELQMADFGLDKTGTSRPRYAQLLSAVQESGQPEKLAAMVNTVEALKKQVLVQHAYRELSFGQLMDQDLVRTYVDGKYYQDGYGE